MVFNEKYITNRNEISTVKPISHDHPLRRPPLLRSIIDGSDLYSHKTDEFLTPIRQPPLSQPATTSVWFELLLENDHLVNKLYNFAPSPLQFSEHWENQLSVL